MIILGMDLGPHWLFIVAAYALALAVVLGLVAWVVLACTRWSRTLRDLEARGLRRRSSSAGPPR